MQKLERDLAALLGNHQLGQKRMTGLRGGCTGCRGADGALPKASKFKRETSTFRRCPFESKF